MGVSRFIPPHTSYFNQALKELKHSYKETHWMWFIFPQIVGLGYSDISKYFAIKSVDELFEYSQNKYLDRHTRKLYSTLLHSHCDDPIEIFGDIDAQKFQSHLTLFAIVPKYRKQCYNLIDKYFDGMWDFNTIQIYTEMEDH